MTQDTKIAQRKAGHPVPRCRCNTSPASATISSRGAGYRSRLPIGRNSPQHPPHGLYAELISGTSFTTARAENRRTWTYRIQPSVSAPSPMRGSITD